MSEIISLFKLIFFLFKFNIKITFFFINSAYFIIFSYEVKNLALQITVDAFYSQIGVFSIKIFIFIFKNPLF